MTPVPVDPIRIAPEPAVRPVAVGDCSYMNKTFKGLEAHCLERGASRVFRVDRILELKAVCDETPSDL